MGRRVGSAALMGLLLLLPGCAKQLQRIEVRTDEIANAQARMAAGQREMAAALERLDARDAEREAQLVERRAELEQQLRALDRVVRQLDARGQEQDDLLQRISAALDLLTRQSVADRGPVDPSAATADAEGGAVGSLQSPGQDVFDAAFDDYTGGRYGLARQGFEEVLARFGDSQLADDAQYWAAETFYAEGDHETAAARFEAVLARWPRGEYVAPSLLKLAYAQLEMGQREDAARTLRRLVEEHPDSPEALIAEHRLTNLEEAAP